MLSTVLAAESSSGVDINTLVPLLNVGFLGIIFVLLISKNFIVTKYYAEEGFRQRDEEVERLRKELDAYKSQVDELQDMARKEMVPAIVETNRLSAEYIRVLSSRVPPVIQSGPGGGNGPSP